MRLKVKQLEWENSQARITNQHPHMRYIVKPYLDGYRAELAVYRKFYMLHVCLLEDEAKAACRAHFEKWVMGFVEEETCVWEAEDFGVDSRYWNCGKCGASWSLEADNPIKNDMNYCQTVVGKL